MVGSAQACTNGPNGCDSSRNCLSDSGTCGTGPAGDGRWSAAANTFTCGTDQPFGSLQNGNGLLCYDTLTNCETGPNQCGPEAPCVQHFSYGSVCSSGQSAGSGNTWICTASLPEGGLPSGSGQLCYTSKARGGCLSTSTADANDVGSMLCNGPFLSRPDASRVCRVCRRRA